MRRGKFIIEKFNGVSEFASVIAKRPVNSHFWEYRDDLSSDASNYEFTLTSDYKEADRIMTTGYQPGLDNLKEAGAFKVHSANNATRNIPSASVVGYAPHVPNAIAGIPQSMISSSRIQQKSKVVTILYDGGASAYMNAKKFVEAGRTLLSLILKLEMQGYRVQLDILDAFCTSKEKALCVITVKNHRQPLNPLKISYMLLHPSFFRRQGFRWLETNPETTFRYDGYGQPLKHCCPYGEMPDDVRRYLSDNKVLENGTFYTSLYEVLDNSAEQLADKMGITIKK